MSKEIPKEGDTVRVTYEGEVDTVHATAFRMAGIWHYHSGRTVTSVEVIEPALQVGWHRVEDGENGGIRARHWDGERWGYTEDRHPTLRTAYRSLGFLGGDDGE